ncbi:MAG: SRPBCC family protein [Bacteroidota bacterium]
MQKAIQTKHQIQAPVSQVWSLIKSGEKWEDWFPILTGSRVEGNQRYCDLDNGDTLEELFLSSEAEKTFVYTIQKQKSFPATNITGIMRLEANGPDATTLHWSVDMEVENEEVFAQLKENIAQMYAASAHRLEELNA